MVFSNNGGVMRIHTTWVPLVVAVLFGGGCGTGFAVLVHPQPGVMVECRDDLFDGITDTIGRCVEAYEQGFVVRGRR
jgi:hypothetical protein